jgi:tetratricopeptide (TPR) repeat protein
MVHDEVNSRSGKISELLSEAFELIREGELLKSSELLEEALSIDFEDKEVISSLKAVNFWRERLSVVEGLKSPFECGEYLLGQWKHFSAFLDRVGFITEQCLHSIRTYIFETALVFFNRVLNESSGRDEEILLRIGRCYKGKGDFDKAIQVLESANQIVKNKPDIIAELADCYAMINEIQASKVFFREAFFINPQGIDLECLESEMIQRLIKKVSELGYGDPVLEEWIPVYGVLYGIFTIKRELKPIEFGKLRQSIYSLENEIRDDFSKTEILMPRLINRYFWLIDHYISTHEDRERIDEVLLRLKVLNEKIYKKYIS